MSKCKECKFNYKNEEVMQPLITSKGTQLLCAICALKVRNQLHGLPENTPFQGEQAQYMYELALKERSL